MPIPGQTDYGTDLAGLTDLPDPEQTIDGDLGLAYALARRVLTPSGGLAETGDPVPYDSIDIREWLGKRVTQGDLDQLGAQASAVMSQESEILTVTATASYAGGVITLTANGTGAQGPFSLVLAVSALTTTLLRGG